MLPKKNITVNPGKVVRTTVGPGVLIQWGYCWSSFKLGEEQRKVFGPRDIISGESWEFCKQDSWAGSIVRARPRLNEVKTQFVSRVRHYGD
jgi:hypothetical protein